MGIEDLFGQGRNQQRFDYDRHYGHDDHYQNYGRDDQQYQTKLKMINSIVNNPKLKLILILAAIVIIAIVILLIILLFPLLIKLFNYLSENGIQGILDTIWKGTK